MKYGFTDEQREQAHATAQRAEARMNKKNPNWKREWLERAHKKMQEDE